MAKIDIKHAYRIVPVHPDDYYNFTLQEMARPLLR